MLGWLSSHGKAPDRKTDKNLNVIFVNRVTICKKNNKFMSVFKCKWANNWYYWIRTALNFLLLFFIFFWNILNENVSYPAGMGRRLKVLPGGTYISLLTSLSFPEVVGKMPPVTTSVLIQKVIYWVSKWITLYQA